MGAAQDLPFGFSPQSGEFEDQFDPLKFEDDEFALGDDDLDESGFFGDDHDGSLEPSSASGSQFVKKKRNNNRKGPQNADKRATHNAVERKRRESLNTRFIDLAKALPTTKHIKRPSKAVIVSKALDYVYDASAREHALTKENNELRCEVDQLRIRLGMPPLPPPVGLPEHRAATQATLRKNLRNESTVPPEPSSSSSSAPTAVQQPTTPLDESPAGSSSSYLGGAVAAVHQSASPASIASATPSSAASALFDVTSPELASAVAYPAFFSTAPVAAASSSSELGGSPAEAPLALGSAPSPVTSAPSFYPVPTSLPSAFAHQQHAQAQAQAQAQVHAAHAYSAALATGNPALLGQFYAMQQQQAQQQQQQQQQQQPFGGPAYLSPQVLLALQQQQAAHAHAQAQAHFAPDWMSPIGASPPQSTGMFAASF
ncbi:uncharacterized protein RHOBADRAFT_66196 [Rhodotorula graminis WP1]|uniref:BHLH domain-containing protein n=1 Tax=Rhodotorula graminis (strain WP1) TaxID=578459 RepID=A0A194S6H7_RHOGW|nr:uncharacterized protein RHOBADRAFT_66196 [Rhodotorula graminis WP1]KPV76333.1 hypothetical protein RHOBADRAFT_66196 [Rhodotorula graminis WP1]